MLTILKPGEDAVRERETYSGDQWLSHDKTYLFLSYPDLGEFAAKDDHLGDYDGYLEKLDEEYDLSKIVQVFFNTDFIFSLPSNFSLMTNLKKFRITGCRWFYLTAGALSSTIEELDVEDTNNLNDHFFSSLEHLKSLKLLTIGDDHLNSNYCPIPATLSLERVIIKPIPNNLYVDDRERLYDIITTANLFKELLDRIKQCSLEISDDMLVVKFV